MASARAIVEAEVRESVRRRVLDPGAVPQHLQNIQTLIDEAVGAYAHRSSSVALPPLGDATEVAKVVRDSLAGFGQLQPLLDDPAIEELWINAPDRIFIARQGRSELTTLVLSRDEIAELVERMLRTSGRRVDVSTPFVDATLPDGSRLHVVIAPITRGHPAVNIRKFVPGVRTLDELVALGSIPAQVMRFLEASVRAGLNILVSGGTQAGKTTLLNALCAAIPAAERVVTVEEVFELQLRAPDVVALQTRPASLDGTGEVGLRKLVVEALRMRPARLIVGEVRQAECLDLLVALNSGLPGMCTLHANSAREALVKMCTLPLLAGANVSAGFVVPTVASAVDLVVQVGMLPDGTRRIREVVAVTGRVEGEVIETSELFATRNARLVRAGGHLADVERFAAAGVDVAELLRPFGTG